MQRPQFSKNFFSPFVCEWGIWVKFKWNFMLIMEIPTNSNAMIWHLIFGPLLNIFIVLSPHKFTSSLISLIPAIAINILHKRMSENFFFPFLCKFCSILWCRELLCRCLDAWKCRYMYDSSDDKMLQRQQHTTIPRWKKMPIVFPLSH